MEYVEFLRSKSFENYVLVEIYGIGLDLIKLYYQHFFLPNKMMPK